MATSVRLIDDPVLRKPCDPVDPWTAEVLLNIDDLLREMHETMRAENGIGLAANQIGRSLRIFILKSELSYKAFINPELLHVSELVDFETEGCLSIPGAIAATKRYRKVRLRWIDKEGTNQEADFENMDAFAIQHEMDHLDGKLYVDQLKPLKRDMVIKKHKKFVKFRR
jgi:peptide deformylase